MNKQPPSTENKQAIQMGMGLGTVFGLVFGLILGLALGNVALWMPAMIGFGMACGMAIAVSRNEQQ